VQSDLQSELITGLVIVVVIGLIVYRRLQAQPVRAGRTVAITAIIVLFSLLGAAQNPRVLVEPLFQVLVPVMLVVGFGLGLLLMQTIRFWRDEHTGQLWMRGGLLYLAIWMATVGLRYGVSYLATGSIAQTRPASLAPPTTLGIVAADMLFISIGLWLARGYALLRKSSERASFPSGSPTNPARIGEKTDE
jgi:hypothetical protein